MAARPPQSSRVRELDGIRAFAAVSVFLFHLTWRSPLLNGLVDPVTGHLDMGVEVFFVLSGFLVFGPFAAALNRREAVPTLGSYAARRVARVWPGYLVALAGAAVTGLATIGGLGGWLKHATLTYTYFGDRGGDGLRVAWTLVVEVSFYAFVPLFALALTRARSVTPVRASLGVIAAGAAFQVWTAFDLGTPAAVRILPPGLLTLGVGMLYTSCRTASSPGEGVAGWLRTAARHPSLLLGAAAGLYAVLVILVPAGTDIGRRPGDRVAQSLLQGLIAALVVLPLALPGDADSAFRRLLRHPVTAYLGVVSYGLYLWHIPVLAWSARWVKSDDWWVAVPSWSLALGGAVALGAASWHLVEKPVLDAVSSRVRRHRAPPEPSPPQSSSKRP